MKLTIHSVASDSTKTNKSFDKIPDTAADTDLREFVNNFKALTNAVVTTADKIVTTELKLNDN